MGILYFSGHCNCTNYDSRIKSKIKILHEEKTSEREIFNNNQTSIIYIIKGVIDISFGIMENYRLSEGDIMLFPPENKLTRQIVSSSRIMILKINENLTLCQKYTLNNLFFEQNMTNLKHTHLQCNSTIKTFFHLFEENINNQLLCTRFLEGKIEELFYYLRAYYSKEELANFTFPLLSANAQFMIFIWKNYRQAHDVKHFAQLAKSSISVFNQKFKAATGKSAGIWLSEQKKQDIYYEIRSGKKNLKEISGEYHFSSTAHLNTFCKKMFGMTPRQLKLQKNQP